MVVVVCCIAGTLVRFLIWRIGDLICRKLPNLKPANNIISYTFALCGSAHDCQLKIHQCILVTDSPSLILTKISCYMVLSVVCIMSYHVKDTCTFIGCIDNTATLQHQIKLSMQLQLQLWTKINTIATYTVSMNVSQLELDLWITYSYTMHYLNLEYYYTVTNNLISDYHGGMAQLNVFLTKVINSSN